ncbi:hypothetical protein [Zhouia amylolytica]|uniref:Uncharacterized protein n=1 Tax=Zhouia amylolytica AD3 TaxID=1286632 RepID=W2UR38_9FLAO|nr:hypothetical protein [Zhouia amylolytica]ETN95767.1 hypothetical protein P278_14890 [Zhouia amylolytica AD3]
MPQQKGIIKLKGTMGGITFYKTADGYLAREKGGIEKSRMESDPAFQRTRENGFEFGRAGKGSKLLRMALRTLMRDAKDRRVTSRLLKILVSIVKTDTTNARGQRTVQDGELALLKGFDFNIKGKLNTTLFVPYSTNIDRAAGSMQVQLPALTPSIGIEAPEGTTHFKLIIGLTELDFENETFIFDGNETGILPWNAEEIPATDLSASVTANSTLPLFQVMGISFYQEVNGQMYPLKNGAFNALNVIGIDTP